MPKLVSVACDKVFMSFQPPASSAILESETGSCMDALPVTVYMDAMYALCPGPQGQKLCV